MGAWHLSSRWRPLRRWGALFRRRRHPWKIVTDLSCCRLHGLGPQVNAPRPCYLSVIPSAMLLLTAALSTAIARPAVPSARPQITRATATASGATATAPSWQLASTLSTIDALERTGGTRPHSLLTGLFDEASGLCSEGVWHNSWLGVGRLLAARELRLAGDDELADTQLRPP